MEQKKVVGLWIRVSHEDSVKGESPEHHEARGRLYAEAKGWDVLKIYRLDAISGKSVIGLSQTKEMLSDIKSGKITGLIFSKLARLARNTKELLDFADIFKVSGADLISLNESIDTSTPSGRLFYTFIAAMAQWEREEIADRVSASVPIRAKMGKPLGGQASFGYRWEKENPNQEFGPKKLVVDAKEAPIRKLIYELFREHKRKKAVAQILNEKGHRTRDGSKFSDTTIGRLLRDSTAKGVRIANYTKGTGDGKKWVIKPKEEWIVIQCPAVVSAELWDECNKILDEQEKLHKKPTKRPLHIFTGIVFCECGSKMHIPSNSKKYICLKCRKNRIDAQDLEEIYFENLKTFVLTDQHLETFLQNADKRIAEREQELQILLTEKQRLMEEMDKLVRLHMSGEIPKDGFNRYYNPLDEQYKQIDASLPEVQSDIDFLKIEHLNTDELLTEAHTLFDRWQMFDNEAKRSIVEQITDRITIAKEEINIRFSYTPASSNPPQNGNTTSRIHSSEQHKICRIFHRQTRS